MKARLAGSEHDFDATCGPGRIALRVDGRDELCEFARLGDHRCELTVAGRTLHVWTAVRDGVMWVDVGGRTWQVELVLDEAADQAAGGADVLAAPMPGTVLSVAVAAGHAVDRGETLLVLESMKMHTEVVAERGGVVEAVHVAAGETVQRDTPLVAFAPLEEGT